MSGKQTGRPLQSVLPGPKYTRNVHNCRWVLDLRELPRNYNIAMHHSLLHNDLLLALWLRTWLCASLLATYWLVPMGPCRAQAKGSILIDFLEKGVDAPLTCRVKVKDEGGRAARPRGVLEEHGWCLVEGGMQFKGRAGSYSYEAHHGPQFAAASGGFILDRNAEAQDVVYLTRHANLLDEGWFAGDMLAHSAADATLRWLPAEDLTMACVVSQQALASDFPRGLDEDGRWVDGFNFHDARPGSGLVFHHWMPPARVPAALPSSRLIVMAKQAQPTEQLPVHIEIQKPWARDTPIWLASGRIDSIQLLGSPLTWDGSPGENVQPLEIPEGAFNGQRGSGRLVEKIYWMMLEAGLRIPPSAGSGFGSAGSPLGYNRVYAATRSAPSPAEWWRAVGQGRSFVTNGPLLRVAINQQLPGHVFALRQGESLKLDIDVKLTVADPVEYLDVIFNGQSLYQARLDEHARQGGRHSAAGDSAKWLAGGSRVDRA